jgi:anhydro-N-acetylmuramic acid kinase
VTTRWIIGLASGSSADGIDAALLETEGVGLDLRVRLLHALSQPYGKELRDLILRAVGPGPCDARQFALLHRLLGETFAAAARQVADRASFSLQRVQCLGCPGHTVWHDPDGRFPATLGLGMAAVVAERTGLTTVSDFRARDVVAGGQGVPLGALADYLLFRHPNEDRLLVHLGGLARVVYLPANCRIHEIVGFEAGPCNVLLDALMRQLTGGREAFDPGGKHAVQGRCLDALLQRWLLHPYLQKRPPKSLPPHAFGDEFASQAVQQARQMHWSLHDLLCTATHLVAHSITGALRRVLPPGRPPARVILSGGGTRNGLLWHLLGQQFGGLPLERTDRHGIPADARKAMTFAILAALTVDGVPANVPSATGAAGSRLLGSLTPGAPANWSRCLAWMAAQLPQPAPADAE